MCKFRGFYTQNLNLIAKYRQKNIDRYKKKNLLKEIKNNNQNIFIHIIDYSDPKKI